MSALLAAAAIQPNGLASLQSTYNFECRAESAAGESVVVSAKLTRADEISLGKVMAADFTLAGATSSRVAGEYGAALIGDVAVLDNLVPFTRNKLPAANRIVVDRPLIGPGTIMLKSTSRDGSGTITYFGFCQDRAQAKAKE